MHVVLTDTLTCPRCGPEFGLILLADRVADRRILDGTLACSNCRERYLVRDGGADLRFGEPLSGPDAGAGAGPQALPLAALLGVTEGPALVLVVGAAAVHARAIADMIPGIEVIAAANTALVEADAAGVSSVAVAARLPFRTGSMRGVALTDAGAAALIEEAARVAAPRARVVVWNGNAEVAERLGERGLHIIAQDDHATVAQRAAF